MASVKTKGTLDIGDVAKQTGIAPSTLRFYEEKGLIKSSGRNGLRRQFDAQVLEHLELIALGQYAGFSLEEIIEIFATEGRFRIDRKQLLVKATELEQKIKRLIAVKNTLHHVAHCSRPNQLDCPKFQKLLKLAGRQQSKDRASAKKTRKTRSC
jgi:MerR family redox-sensitive transcriptional activator SoxR